MEPRDSSSPLSQSEDSALSAALGKEAALLFQSGKYADCLRVLNQLLQKKENDPKVLHNMAIVESFQDGCSDPKRLLEALNDIKKRYEELAHASEEQAEAVNNLGSKFVSGSKGVNCTAQVSTENSLPVVYADDFDKSVTLFNIALVWFFLHEYGKSFSVLEPLYQNIEPLDEGTARRICLLLLDVALLSHHASRSADVISYLEKVFCGNGLVCQSDGSSLQQQPIAKSALTPTNSTIPDASNNELVTGANASESPLARTLSDETEYESFLSSLVCPMKPSAVQSSNDLSRVQAEMRLKLHLYKVQFSLLTRNLKAAKREVKLAMNIARGRDYSMALFLKSQLEYARGNHRKAIKLLVASGNRMEMGISSMYYNNLGCIYNRLGKHHTSTIFFSKALNNSLSLRKEKPLKFSSFSRDKSLLIVYNCGLQYLACGKPLLAARCFFKASSIYHSRSLLWLRIAECCLMAYEKGLLKINTAPSDKSEVKIHVIGKGKWRQLAIDDKVSRNGQVDFEEREVLWLGDDKLPNLSLSLARKSLFNALHLSRTCELECSKTILPLNSEVEETESREKLASMDTNYKVVSDDDLMAAKINVNGELKEQKGGDSLNASLQSSIFDYEDFCRKQNLMIKQALYADLSYVELELGNPLKALSAARSLLRFPECSRIYTFLGNMYAAEALCLLNRPKEAAEHLSAYISAGHVELPYNQDDCERWWQVEKSVDYEEPNVGSSHALSTDEPQPVILNPEEARGILYANLAALSAMQGDLEQANQYVGKALSTIPSSPEAVITATYVDLMRGKREEALFKLKLFSHVRFLKSSLTVNGSTR